VTSRIVIALAAGLYCSATFVQAQSLERCDRATGLAKIMTQWHGELERARGRKFLPLPTPNIETDCVERQVLFPQWWRALAVLTKQNAMVQPNAQSVLDCRRLVGTLAQWQELLVDMPGNPGLSDPAAGIACTAPRGGASAPAAAPPNPRSDPPGQAR